MIVEIDEGERQLILLALAQLSVARPGWDHALNKIACKMDNVIAGRGNLYDGFRHLKAEEGKPNG
jgi:hypothetical protein